MSTKRKYLNWRPGIDFGNDIGRIKEYDPWDAFPGRDILTASDAGLVTGALHSTTNPFQRRELGVILAIVRGGGYVRKIEQERGVDDVQSG